MTVTVTMTPAVPVLSAALWLAVAAAGTWSTCLLAVFAVRRKPEMFGRLLGWQAVTFGLSSAALFSMENWPAGVFVGGVAAAAGLLWRRERNRA